MNIFDYYTELLNKPKYMLSAAESAFIELFPYIIIAGVLLIIIIITAIVDKIRKK